MGQTKKKIVIADNKKFFRLVLVLLLVLAAVVVVLINPWKDPIEKQIEKTLGTNVKIIRTYIAAYDKNGVDMSDNTVFNTLTEENVVKFKVIYNYQTESGSVANYPVTDGLKVTVNDSAYATVMEDGSIVIPNGLSSEYELTVNVKYKKISSDYTYTIKPNLPEETQTED